MKYKYTQYRLTALIINFSENEIINIYHNNINHEAALCTQHVYTKGFGLYWRSSCHSICQDRPGAFRTCNRSIKIPPMLKNNTTITHLTTKAKNVTPIPGFQKSSFFFLLLKNIFILCKRIISDDCQKSFEL